jgi:uncharacterized membrane protein YfcA
MTLSILSFTLLVWLGSVLGGLLGSLTGLGGGVIIVPLLTLVFGVDIRYAVGASLVSVIATSSGAAAAYVKEGFTNTRIAMFLQVFTTVGALVGAFLAGVVSGSVIAIIFGLVLLYTVLSSYRQVAPEQLHPEPDKLATRLRMNGSYPSLTGIKAYFPRAVPVGASLMFLAGALSGLLGIGSGTVKVLAMDRAMRLPFKVSTTTSNLMIGVTAAASAGAYFSRGWVDPGLAMPVMLGVLLGSVIGARLLTVTPSAKLRQVFNVVILIVGLEMLFNGLTGRI